MKTTLNKIREHLPYSDGWAKLLKDLGKTEADDEPLLITTLLDNNGLDDALWCLRAVDGHQREMRLYAVDCARSVQHLMTDARSVAAIDVAERYANGLATESELTAAWTAAWAAAGDAARDAAGTATWAAARAATRAAARTAARAAARTAARTAARAAARTAAGAAAWAAAGGAARDAAWAAAGYAAMEIQADLLRIVCAEIEQGEHHAD